MRKFVLIFSMTLAAIPALIWAMGLETFSGPKLLVFFGPFVLVIGFILINRRPALAVYSAVLALFPVLGLIMPPARLGISTFHAFGLLLLILGFHVGNTAGAMAFFSRRLRMFWLPLLLLVPTVIFAVNVQTSAIEWAAMWTYYAAFVVGLHFLSEPRNMAITHILLSTSLAIVAISVLLQKFSGTSFAWLYSDRGLELVRGTLIKRGSGVFQDPQKAAQFIAMLTAYLTIVWQRRALPRGWTRILAPIAIVLAIPALLLTVSRLAIAAGLVSVFIGFLLLGRQAFPLRVMSRALAIGILVAGTVLWGSVRLVDMLPGELQVRSMALNESVDARLDIWMESFHIFLDHPLTGIGPGNYREYFIVEHPGYVAAQGGLGSALVPDQPESGYLKILYEVGILGSLAILWFAQNMGRLIIANIRSQVADVASRGWATAAALCVFLVTFTTLFTTSDPRNGFLLILFLTISCADRIRNREQLVAAVEPNVLHDLFPAPSRTGTR